MKAILILFLITCCIRNYTFSQDIHLSQFYTNDHVFNPAKVGDHEGDLRICSNYRNQWRQISNQPLTTMMTSFDKKFHYYSHEISGGFLLIRDQFVGFQTNVTGFLVSGAYGFNYKGNKLRGGVQTGMVSNSTNLDVQTFPNQWDYQNGVFDKGIYNQENTMKASQVYWDLNMGGTWSRKINNITILSGLAFSHVNRPKDTYFSQHTERRRIRKILTTSLQIPISSAMMIEPQLNWMFTANANELLLGSNFKYTTKLKSLPLLYAGFFYRHGIVRALDAFYPVVGVTYKRFNIGLSYDVNVSSLSKYTKRVGTFEFSLIYTSKSSKVKYKILPCNRF